MNNNAKDLDPRLLQYNAFLNLEQTNKAKLNAFKERIAPFKLVKSLKEAKDLAAKILPTSNEINRFYIGDAKCIIVNKPNTFRITVITENEFTSYCF